MSAIGFVMEKVRHGGNLSSGERKMLADEIDRLSSKVEALAQELSRREFADGIARQADRERVEHLQRVEDDVTRLRKSLEHERQRRITENTANEEMVKFLKNVLRDIHYGLLHQPELTREELAAVIAREVEPHPRR